MSFKFSRRSRENLRGVHPDLVAVAELALSRSSIDFMVIDGVRTKAEQRALVAKGASRTMNSRHLTGHAMDIVPYGDFDGDGDIDGDDLFNWTIIHKLAPVIKQAAHDLGVPIEWGGDWRTIKDGPHWELPWAEYAADDMRPRAKTGGAQDNKAEAIALLRKAIELLEA